MSDRATDDAELDRLAHARLSIFMESMEARVLLDEYYAFGPLREMTPVEVDWTLADSRRWSRPVGLAIRQPLGMDPWWSDDSPFDRLDEWDLQQTAIPHASRLQSAPISLEWVEVSAPLYVSPRVHQYLSEVSAQISDSVWFVDWSRLPARRPKTSDSARAWVDRTPKARVPAHVRRHQPRLDGRER